MNQPWVYIVLFGLVLIVYAKISPKNQGNKISQGNILGDVEEAMDHFAAELDEQNKALIQMFAETKKEYGMQYAGLISRIETLEKQGLQWQEEIHRLHFLLEQLQSQQLASMIRPSDPSLIHSETMISTPLMDSEPSEDAAIPESQELQTSVVLMNIKDRYKELFSLFDQGKSTEYIAKKLGMNKGEINLIIQLAKQEEVSNA